MISLNSQLKDGLKEILPYFLISRVFFFIILISTSIISVEKIPAREGHNYNIKTNFDYQIIKEKISKTLLSADASWYLEIAKYGYPKEINTIKSPQHWVFFPAFPILIKGIALITNSFLGSALILNFIFFLSALSCLSYYLKIEGFDQNSRQFVCAALCFHPGSYFFSLPITEAGFIFFLVASLYIIKYSNINSLLTLSLGFLFTYRPTGFLMLPALFLIAFKKKQIKILLSMGIGISFLILYFFHLWQISGSPFAWIQNQEYWGRPILNNPYSSKHYTNNYSQIFAPWNFNGLHLISIIIATLSILFFFVKKNYVYALMILIPILVFLQNGSLLSATRILMPLFPIQIFLAITLKNEKIRALYLMSSAIIFGIMSLLYCLNITLAMA